MSWETLAMSSTFIRSLRTCSSIASFMPSRISFMQVTASCRSESPGSLNGASISPSRTAYIWSIKSPMSLVSRRRERTYTACAAAAPNTARIVRLHMMTPEKAPKAVSFVHRIITAASSTDIPPVTTGSFRNLLTIRFWKGYSSSFTDRLWQILTKRLFFHTWLFFPASFTASQISQNTARIRGRS